MLSPSPPKMQRARIDSHDFFLYVEALQGKDLYNDNSYQLQEPQFKVLPILAEEDFKGEENVAEGTSQTGTTGISIPRLHAFDFAINLSQITIREEEGI